MIVDEAGHQNLVGQPVIDDRLATFPPRSHGRQIPYSHNAIVDNTDRGGMRQRFIHRVDSLGGEYSQRLWLRIGNPI